MGTKGNSNYCQECGACAVRSVSSDQSHEALISTIVDAVLRDLGKQDISNSASQQLTIPLGVSNHHIHLREESFKTLFGETAKPEIYRDLYQPGEFALKQTCMIIGPKMRPIHEVRVLGPFRSYDQVEVSFTDAMQLGLNPPICDSGDLGNAAPITIIGPAGSLVLQHGAIIANRHVHMNLSDAERFGVKQGDFIKVKLAGAKPSVFEKVLVRTNKAWKLQIHLDTDDANAAHVVCNQAAIFVGKE
jgi:putative phosphotransacetylase